MIDLERAIRHPFEDKDWAVKMLIGAGVGLVPVLNFAMNGYALQIQRNTAAGHDVPMPRWEDFSTHLIDGLKLFVVQLIYAMPILVVSFGLMILGIIFGFGASADNMRSSMRNALGSGFIVITLGLTCLIMLYGLAYAFILPATYIQLARTGQIGSAFNFTEMLALIKRRAGDYTLVVVTPLILALGFGLVFGVISIIPFAGLCVTFMFIPLILVINPYLAIVFGHLYGQLMRA